MQKLIPLSKQRYMLRKNKYHFNKLDKSIIQT